MIWDYFTLLNKYFLGSVVGVYDAPNFLWVQVHYWVSFMMSQHPCDSHDMQSLWFGADSFTAWEMECGKTSSPKGENSSHQPQCPFSNSKESIYLLWTDLQQNPPRAQNPKIFVLEASQLAFQKKTKNKTHFSQVKYSISTAGNGW